MFELFRMNIFTINIQSWDKKLDHFFRTPFTAKATKLSGVSKIWTISFRFQTENSVWNRNPKKFGFQRSTVNTQPLIDCLNVRRFTDRMQINCSKDSAQGTQKSWMCEHKFDVKQNQPTYNAFCLFPMLNLFDVKPSFDRHKKLYREVNGELTQQQSGEFKVLRRCGSNPTRSSAKRTWKDACNLSFNLGCDI